jgi:hypothetical protein
MCNHECFEMEEDSGKPEDCCECPYNTYGEEEEEDERF